MLALLIAIVTQALTFIPLALGISISYHILRATDMTLDGSFVLGAAIFAKLVSVGISPIIATLCALCAGALAGMMVSCIQRGGWVDPLLAGVLATFILTSLNLVIMGKPNINLLSSHTLLSNAFNISEIIGWILVATCTIVLCGGALLIMSTRFGLTLRALGDNSHLLIRLGYPLERFRLAGFALTNTLAAAAGCLTAQTVGYADIGMGMGMTLTGIGAVILGQQIMKTIQKNISHTRIISEFIACLLGVVIYFLALNGLLRLNINPIYLKMILGLLLIIFLRSAINPGKRGHIL